MSKRPTPQNAKFSPQRNEQRAEATAKWANQGHWVLTVFECPYCDGAHRHTGGTDDAYPYYGRRYVPPCSNGAEYIVVEVIG
jgi:hypothetical protein